MLLAWGCKGGTTKSTPPNKTGSSPFSDAAVATGRGTLDMYSPEPDRKKTFTLQWETASASAKDEEHYMVDARQVSGQIFRDGQLVATFSADSGSADKGADSLALHGNVKIKSVDTQSSLEGTILSCESVTYAGSDEIIKARGNVYVKGKGSEMGPFDDVWCSNDLSEVAAPDVFVPVRHNHASTPKL